MICTVTLNTSIDKAYRMAAPVRVGEVQRVSEVIDRAGGKGLNAARAVKTCGEEVLATGFVGGHNGALLCELLDADGVPHDFCEIVGETRCCINALDPTGESTEFLEPGCPVTAADLDAVVGRVAELAAKADVVTINGSAPAGAPVTVYARLIEAIKATGAPVLLDTSGDLLVEGVKARPTMVKPNTDEIAAVLGHPVGGRDEVLAAARELHDRGVEKVVVSLGGAGSVMASDAGTFVGQAPAIDVVNPVGSGDTLVGAFAVAMARAVGDPKALAYAMACASANCLSAETGAFDPAVADELLGQTVVERVG